MTDAPGKGTAALDSSQVDVSPTFETEITGAVSVLRRSLSETLEAAGVRLDSSAALMRTLKLNRTLSWRISKIVSESEPFQAVQLLPGRAAFDGLLKTLRSAGAPEETVDRLREVLDALDEVIARHCGDRDTLDIMLLNRSDPLQGERAENLRRLAFRGNSAAWGVQARVQCGAHFIAPSESRPDLLDAATVSGFVDFRRLRSDAVWTIGHASSLFDDGTERQSDTTRPIDTLSPSGAPLLMPFCSMPAPAIRVVPSPTGGYRYELSEGPVGIAASLNCFTGWVDRAVVPRYRQPNDSRGELYMSLSTPVETAIFDVFFHRSMAEARNPEVALYSQLPGGPVYPRCGVEAGRMFLHEKLIDLGDGPPDVVTADIPHYPRMIDYVFEKLGWRARDFRGFRLRVKYPSIPVLAVLRYPLPERGA
jgi:hypothetical protein